MTLETRPIRLAGKDYLLTKTTVIDKMPNAYQHKGGGFHSDYCNVDKLVLSEVKADGTLVPVKTKTVSRFSHSGREFSIDDIYVSKRIERENLITKGESVLDNFVKCNRYKGQHAQVDIPGKVAVDYITECTPNAGTKLQGVLKNEINLTDKEVLGQISNAAKRIIKRLFTLR